MNKSLYRFILIMLTFYVGFCLFIYLFQNNLLYFPTGSIVYQQNTVINYNGHLLGIEINQNAVKNIQEEPVYKTIVLFHGNAGNANNRSYYEQFFNHLDESTKHRYRLIVAEYPGFGLRKDETANKNNIIASSRELMQYAIKSFGQDIIVVGESLGTGVASQMASEYKISKLILITPYTSILDVASDKLSFLPVRFLLQDNYDSEENLSHYQGKALFIIAENDEVIPTQFAYKLFSSTKTMKSKIVVKKAQHTNWFAYLDDEQKQDIYRFINDN